MVTKIVDNYGSMPAADYWRMRGERSFPATCRLTATLEQIPPEELCDYFTRFVHHSIDADPGVRIVDGYHQHNR